LDLLNIKLKNAMNLTEDLSNIGNIVIEVIDFQRNMLIDADIKTISMSKKLKILSDANGVNSINQGDIHLLIHSKQLQIGSSRKYSNIEANGMLGISTTAIAIENGFVGGKQGTIIKSIHSIQAGKIPIPAQMPSGIGSGSYVILESEKDGIYF